MAQATVSEVTNDTQLGSIVNCEEDGGRWWQMVVDGGRWWQVPDRLVEWADAGQMELRLLESEALHLDGNIED